jgi:hypothetical protein
VQYAVHVDGATIHVTGPDERQVEFGDGTTSFATLSGGQGFINSTVTVNAPDFVTMTGASVNEMLTLIRDQQVTIASQQVDIEALKQFVGMMPPSMPPPSMPPPSMPPPNMPPPPMPPAPSVLIGSKTFTFFAGTLSWTAAHADCASRGQSLALITSAQENSQVTSFISGKAGTIWIGVADVVDEGVWLDANGALVTYFNWERGDPNNWSNEDCVVIRGQYYGARNWRVGFWQDYHCHYKMAYLCSSSA